ncbi:FkbM family methyltransferase [Spirosoma aerolatum]|uniref:FkbM family methyltransferase n=1 Tax=Spirosoma aerolatum TaxID=1211326 RepID=UPI0009AE8C92|nr:FkbM family methyltransferase [Spirosoma aerolatum]
MRKHLLPYFLLRILKKIKLLKYVKLNAIIYIEGGIAKIPVNKGVGYPNLFLHQDCFTPLFRKFCPENRGSFVDIGTNIGQTLLKAIDRSINYVGFEPNPICFSYIKELILINNYGNCRVENFALSDKEQKLVLRMNENSDASASVVESLRPNYFVDSQVINCIPYDSLYLDNQLSFVKIDVEGAELEVLAGMKESISRYKPLILCEVLDSFSSEVLEFTQDRASKVCALLKEIGYQAIQLNQAKNKLKSFKLLDSITIKQWTLESYDLNDYLFFHTSKQAEVLSALKTLCV